MGELVVQKHLGRRVFLILIVMLTVFAPISTDMYLPALGDIVEELATNESTLNMTLYGFMLMLAISMLVMGPLIDKYGRKKLLLACLVEYIVTSVVCAFVNDVYSLIVFRLLQAFGSGGIMTIATAFVKDSFEGPTLSKVLGIIAIIGVLGPIIAPIAGAALINTWGWRSTFIAPAVFAAICLIISLFLTETLPEDQRVSGGMKGMLRGMGRISRDRSFMVFLGMITILNAPFMAYLSVSSYIYESGFGLDGTMYSILLAVAIFISIVVMVTINHFSAHTVNRKMLPLYFGMGLVGSVLLLTIGSRSWILFLVSFLFLISASTTIRPWGMGVLMRSHPGDTGAVSSMINSVFFVMGTIGMVFSTLNSDYVMMLGFIGLVATAIYAVLYLVLRSMGFSKVRELDGTPAGEDVQ